MPAMAVVVQLAEQESGGSATRPAGLRLGTRQIAVSELLDRWYGRECDYFKVRGDDGATYILKHHPSQNTCELVFYSTLQRDA